MSSALTLVVITVIFVFHRKWALPMFIHDFYDQVVFVYILPTFRENFQRKLIFIFLQNERKFRPKFAITLVILQDNLNALVKI